MIDHNPSDISCVYYTFMHANERASRAGKTLVSTFDQPLYWKAKCIFDAEPATSALRNAIPVLGEFQTCMSFIGAIGFLVADSGLLEILSQVYVPNTVRSMLQDKAVSRSVRAMVCWRQPLMRTLNYQNWIEEGLMAMTCYQNPIKKLK